SLGVARPRFLLWADGGHFAPLTPSIPQKGLRRLRSPCIHWHRKTVPSDGGTIICSTSRIPLVLEALDRTHLVVNILRELNQGELNVVKLSEAHPGNVWTTINRIWSYDRMSEELPLHKV